MTAFARANNITEVTGIRKNGGNVGHGEATTKVSSRFLNDFM
jgi:hypothetical protein